MPNHRPSRTASTRDVAAAVADERDLSSEPGILDRLLGADNHLVAAGGDDVDVRVGLQHVLRDRQRRLGQVLPGGGHRQLDVRLLVDDCLEPFEAGALERQLGQAGDVGDLAGVDALAGWTTISADVGAVLLEGDTGVDRSAPRSAVRACRRWGRRGRGRSRRRSPRRSPPRSPGRGRCRRWGRR